MSRLLLVSGVAVLVVAGCGSSNKTLSYSGLTDQANALCKAGNAEFAKIKTPKAQADLIEKKYLPKFKDLNPPDALKPSVDKFISVTEAQIAAVRKGDNASLQKLSEESDAAASKMGAKECIN
jgi:hypothetical protein